VFTFGAIRLLPIALLNSPYARFFINGEQVFDMTHSLRPSDAVQIVQALSGG